jgi:GH25 family lysozyme M1 (1,4-beta-N-acetylmuramidase)
LDAFWEIAVRAPAAVDVKGTDISLWQGTVN